MLSAKLVEPDYMVHGHIRLSFQSVINPCSLVTDLPFSQPRGSWWQLYFALELWILLIRPEQARDQAGEIGEFPWLWPYRLV